MTDFATHRDLADIRERLARIEQKTDTVVDGIPKLAERVSAVERWRLQLMAVASAVAAVVTYFTAEIKRALTS